MKTLFKILLYLTGLVVALVVIAAIVIPLYVDPNDYKEEMAKAVQEHTGRKLSIDGDIGLSVFPWLGIELGKVALGNAAGFKEPVFAGAERVDIRVKLLPLLSKQLEMNTVSVHGLRINLARDKQGRTNWEDLSQPAGKGSKPAPTEETSGIGDAPPIGALAIGGVDVQDAQIRWRDEQAGQQLAIEGFTLHTGAIVPGKPIDLDLKFHLRGSQPQVDGDLALQGQIDLDLESQRYRIKNLTLNSQFSGEAVSGKTLKTELVTEVDLNLQQQTLTLPKLSLKTLGMAIQGALSVERVLTEPQFNASLDVAEFSPKGLMEQLGMPAVQTADPQVLTKASLKTRIKGSTTQVKLAPLTL
ncbi:MAG: AsmA family protein, partial [Gammaproteobacteria bacterium]|nr:AsmA family protein [Gammaproteobacteria bacterium]